MVGKPKYFSYLLQWNNIIIPKISYSNCIQLEGDDLKTSNPKQAIEMFEKVVLKEADLGDEIKWYHL